MPKGQPFGYKKEKKKPLLKKSKTPMMKAVKSGISSLADRMFKK